MKTFTAVPVNFVYVCFTYVWLDWSGDAQIKPGAYLSMSGLFPVLVFFLPSSLL